MEESDVDEAEAVGDSVGVLASELGVVEAAESMVVLRRKAALCGMAVVLIAVVMLSGETDGEDERREA